MHCASSPETSILPWHSGLWELLWKARQRNRFPHALLFVGTGHSEKIQFANQLTASLLCDETESLKQREGKTCGQCHACRLLAANVHPNRLFIKPDESSDVIKIDQIREVIQFVHETSIHGAMRTIIICPAHAMTPSAANALLKILEEPTPHTVFVLISDQRLRLSQTITSRCQKVVFHKPERELGFMWLQAQCPKEEELELVFNLAEGSPLQAIEWMKEGRMVLRQNLYEGLVALAHQKADPLMLAQEWQTHDTLVILGLILSWLRDLLLFQLSQGQAAMLNSDYRAFFNEITQKKLPEPLFLYWDTVFQSYKDIANKHNLNKQLLLEAILIGWSTYVSC